MKRTGLFVIWIPLLLLIGGTLVFRLTCLDLVISNFFYHAENSAFFVAWEPWFSIYRYGIIPAYAMAVFGLVLLAGGCLAERLKKYRKIGLFLLVFLIVGSVFLVNGIFKEHWGRPRPAEIQQFNGEKPFLPVLHKGTSGEGSSFPSGHASAGYCLSAPFFFLWPRGSRKWAFFFLAFGIFYGTLMGYGRIVQGGHFASDILWSAGIVYFTGLVLHYLFGFHRKMYWG
ncbi:MAG TPA: phosphatase PAP2 family protein [Thermodesulfobacteriaceae bacterium]|nr:phosphatase PAP2 family protein [Thermodesulfobacteriaceae bacterium]